MTLLKINKASCIALATSSPVYNYEYMLDVMTVYASDAIDLVEATYTNAVHQVYKKKFMKHYYCMATVDKRLGSRSVWSAEDEDVMVNNVD